ncbi:MAG: hypothetical protein CVU03_00155 [Bacteroidetes bacterium HGW-Bacteroidetes-2]|jgi:ribosome-associated translation inhibitor RaiA|nr:MAG: hypothetical protein CVU03_00155 [Bacteroidetes bacterium HGW-Bacteroidetes-2]
MQIQINSDKNIGADKRLESYYTSLIEKSLSRFDDTISRIEVHFSDENSEKFGTDDKRCLIEARLNGRQPLVVTNTADTIEKSFSGSLDKMKRKLDTTSDKMRNH